MTVTVDSFGGPTEAMVVGLARNGDQEAFAALVQQRQQWIRTLLQRSCGGRALADDLAQQTFLTAWRELPKLRDAERFGPWLRRIAVNTWLQHARKRDPLDASVAVEAEDGERCESRAGLARDLDRALAQLPANERLCVVLAYNEGMSHTEIAAATELPLGTVKSHVRRGAEHLRRLLSAYAEDH